MVGQIISRYGILEKVGGDGTTILRMNRCPITLNVAMSLFMLGLYRRLEDSTRLVGCASQCVHLRFEGRSRL
jgi:hypothetical protein